MATTPNSQSPLFARTNLAAWCVVPFDAKKRGPVERAEMLHRLGFQSFAYDWRAHDVPSFDAEVEALKRQGIRLVAWWFPTDAEDPNALVILEVCRRHRIHPQLLPTIQASGWFGPIALIAEQGGDAEVTLSDDLTGLHWLSLEIAKPGSGGPRPAFHQPH